MADTVLSATPYSDANRLPVEQRDGYAVSGTATGTTTLFSVDMLGYESITVQVLDPGTTCTITYETSDDNSNWLGCAGLHSTAVGNAAPALTSTGTALYRFPRYGRYFRARVSVYGSGTVSVVGSLSKAPVVITLGQGSSQLVQGAAAHDAAVSGNPVRIAGHALTANYTAVATGDTANLVTTTVGALIEKPYSIPEAEWHYAATNGGDCVNTTTAVTIKAAAAAGLKNYITAIDYCTDSLTNATEFAIRNGAGGAVLWRTKLQASAVIRERIVFPNPIASSAATLLEMVTLSATGAGGVFANIHGYIAP